MENVRFERSREMKEMWNKDITKEKSKSRRLWQKNLLFFDIYTENYSNDISKRRKKRYKETNITNITYAKTRADKTVNCKKLSPFKSIKERNNRHNIQKYHEQNHSFDENFSKRNNYSLDQNIRVGKTGKKSHSKAQRISPIKI